MQKINTSGTHPTLHGHSVMLKNFSYLLVSATANIQIQTVSFKNGGRRYRSKLKNVKEYHKYCQYNIVNQCIFLAELFYGLVIFSIISVLMMHHKHNFKYWTIIKRAVEFVNHIDIVSNITIPDGKLPLSGGDSPPAQARET